MSYSLHLNYVVAASIANSALTTHLLVLHQTRVAEITRRLVHPLLNLRSKNYGTTTSVEVLVRWTGAQRCGINVEGTK
jgi:hypothetical protein